MKAFFSNRLTWFIAGMLVISLVSCTIFSPSAKLARKEAAVAKVEQKLDENKDQIIEKAKVFAKGTDIAISLETNKSKYIEVARDFSGRTVAVLGEPKLEDVNNLKDIISKLTSDQKDLIAKGRKLLEETDKEVYRLQEEKKSLQEQLIQKEEKYKEVATRASLLADKWFKLMTIFWWIVGILIAYVVFKILLVICPPPYNSIFGIFDYILGGLIRGVFKLAPKAMNTAKVVGAEVQTALDHVVVSIQDTKEKIDAKSEATGVKSVGLEQLKAELAKNTDNTTKAIITETKNKLGYI